jgi:hypothetical protein
LIAGAILALGAIAAFAISVHQARQRYSPERTLEEIAAILAVTHRKAASVPEGKIALLPLLEQSQELSVVIHENGNVTSPWGGEINAYRFGDFAFVDLHTVPAKTCAELLVKANTLPGVVRAAATTLAKDEQPVPMARAEIERQCANAATVMRFIARL